MSSTLFWHAATYSPDAGTFRPSDQMIAAAGIEVTGTDDESGNSLEASAWAIMSKSPVKPLGRTMASLTTTRHIVTMFGDIFGLPLLWSTALKEKVPVPYLDKVVHTDVAKDLSDLTNYTFSFNEILDLMDLPLRPKLNIAEAWDGDDPRVQQRIPQRLIIDCCFIALANVRIAAARGDVTPEYIDNFTQVVLEAAAEKVPMASKTFATFLPTPSGEIQEENEPAEVLEEPSDEPAEDLEDEAALELDGDEDGFDDFDGLDEDDF